MIHNRGSIQHRKYEPTQFDQIEQKIDKLIHGLVEEHKRIEQIAKGDDFHGKQNGQWRAPEPIVASNFGALIRKMVVDCVELTIVTTEAIGTSFVDFAFQRGDQLALKREYMLLLDCHVFGYHVEVIKHD